MSNNRQHIVRLTTNDGDGAVYEAAFTYRECEFENGATHGSLGYCVAHAIMMMNSGSALSLLFELADAVEFIGDYDPFENLTMASEQDKLEKEAAWKMINAAREFVELRASRRKAMNKKTTRRKESRT